MPFPFLLRLAAASAVVLGLFAGLNLLIYRRLVTGLVPRRGLRVAAGILLITLLVGTVLLRAVVSRFPFPHSQFFSLLGAAWLGVVAYLGAAVLFFEPLRFWALRKTPPTQESRREAIKQLTAVAALAAGGSTAGYGIYRALAEPDVVELPIRLPQLPKALDGFTLVQLSDLHIGPVIQEQFLKMLVRKVNGLRPDLVAITGDLVDSKVEKLAPTVAQLQKLSSRHGTHFVTGNHDYYSGADAWCAALSRMGMVVLRNRHISIGDAGASFDLIGVDDPYAEHLGERGYDLEAAVAGRRPDRASILLAHQPRNFLEQVVPKGIGLQLSGHTHAGQTFPGTLIADRMWRQASHGLSRAGESALFVSRGCGFVGPATRVGSPPEIVRVILLAG